MELKSISKKKKQKNKKDVIVFIPICYSPLTAYQAESSRNGKKKSSAHTFKINVYSATMVCDCHITGALFFQQ